MHQQPITPAGISLSARTDPLFEFATRVLVHDGLQVPPFDRHDEGSGALRRLGFNENVWTEWVQTAAASIGSVLTAAKNGQNDLTQLAEAANEDRILQRAVRDGRLRKAIHGLRSNDDFMARDPFRIARELHSDGFDHAQMIDLRSRRRPGSDFNEDRLTLYLVAYPEFVAMRLTPDAVLIGMGPDALDWPRLLRAAEDAMDVAP